MTNKNDKGKWKIPDEDDKYAKENLGKWPIKDRSKQYTFYFANGLAKEHENRCGYR